MRTLIYIVVSIVIFTACSKRSVPSKTTNVTVIAPGLKTNSTTSDTSTDLVNNKKDTARSAPSAPTIPTAMIIIDGYGKVLTPANKLPLGSNIKADYAKIARAFTPQQIANLKARYKTVPPKILYVPEQYALRSLKGSYCIYKKKFWYWKKEDGLFYIDQMYYQ